MTFLASQKTPMKKKISSLGSNSCTQNTLTSGSKRNWFSKPDSWPKFSISKTRAWNVSSLKRPPNGLMKTLIRCLASNWIHLMISRGAQVSIILLVKGHNLCSRTNQRNKEPNSSPASAISAKSELMTNSTAKGKKMCRRLKKWSAPTKPITRSPETWSIQLRTQWSTSTPRTSSRGKKNVTCTKLRKS